MKSKKRVCNFRVFYEVDDELLNQSLYSQVYAIGAASAADTWMLLDVAGPQPEPQLALEAPGAAPLAIMGPGGDLEVPDS